MKYTPVYFFLLSLVLLGTTSCKKDDGDDERINLELETFTSLQATFFPTAGGSEPIILAYEAAIDGNSAVPIAASSGPFMTDTEYEMKVLLYNRSADPVKNLTSSVEEESEDYQLLVTVTPNNVFQDIEYLDMDTNGQPIGLNMRFKTSDRFTTGSMRMSFRNKSDKSIMVTPGNAIDNAIGGEVLIDANFQVVVQ